MVRFVISVMGVMFMVRIFLHKDFFRLSFFRACLLEGFPGGEEIIML